MTEWRIIMPAIDVQMTDECITSIDVDLRERVIVIDNCARRLRGNGPQLLRSRHNLGVAASWNLGVRVARAQSAAYVMLASTSTRFEGGARDLDTLTEVMAEREILALMPHPTYWHTALFDMRFFDTVGEADENFYPAYFEECDLERRALLAGLALVDDGQIPEATIKASTVRDGHGVDALRASFPGENTINYEALGEYWQRKWGCHVDDRRDLNTGYRTPFDVDLPLSYWPAVLNVHELHERYGIVGR
jgi:hypothetical protein